MKRQEPDPKCDVCGGTGETLAYVHNPDSHMDEPTGTAPCFCTKDEDEHDDQQDTGAGGGMGIRPWEPTPPSGSDMGGTEAPIPSPFSVSDLQVA